MKLTATLVALLIFVASALPVHANGGNGAGTCSDEETVGTFTMGAQETTSYPIRLVPGDWVYFVLSTDHPQTPLYFWVNNSASQMQLDGTWSAQQVGPLGPLGFPIDDIYTFNLYNFARPRYDAGPVAVTISYDLCPEGASPGHPLQ